MNIYQKLVDVRRDVQHLQKSASGHKYKYATESQVLSAIRPKMDQHNLILEQEMTSLERISFPAWKNNSLVDMQGVRATFTFTWINADSPEEKIVKQMILQNEGLDCKAIGALMTYANRYFLMKYFNIPIDDLDPDTYQEKLETWTPAEGKLITADQLKSLELLINGHDDIRQELLNKLGDMKDMQKEHYNAAVEWVKARIKKKGEKHA